MYTIPAGQQQYIRAGQLQPGLVLNSSGMSPNNQQVVAEEATRKREMRLMKNRLVFVFCKYMSVFPLRRLFVELMFLAVGHVM